MAADGEMADRGSREKKAGLVSFSRGFILTFSSRFQEKNELSNQLMRADVNSDELSAKLHFRVLADLTLCAINKIPVSRYTLENLLVTLMSNS